MRKRILIYLGIFLVGLPFLFLHDNREGIPKADTTNSVQFNHSQKTTNLAQKVGASFDPQEEKASSTIAKSEEVFQQVVDEKNTQIDFYSKVIDQNDNPLSGVRVKMNVRQWYVKSFALLDADAHFLRFETITDADGLFSILGTKGDVISLESIEKEGYELSSKAINGFNYVRGETVYSDKPAIYKMWKKGIPAKLVTFHKATRVPYDGTPMIFDLLKGKKSTDTNAQSDIRVTLTRNPLKRPLGSKEKYDWTADLEAIDGGIIASDDEFMYLAPEIGYQPRLEMRMMRTNVDWTPNWSVSFYLKSRGGQCYGQISVEFMTDSSEATTGFTITSALNPDGSRNLQP